MIHHKYVQELGSSLRYLPTWFPNVHLELGDLLERESLELRGNLRSHGLSFTTRPASARASFEYSSSGGVSISTKLAGQLVAGSSLGEAEVGLIVKFSKENAIVFDASECTSTAISDLDQLGSEILELYRRNRWNRNLIVVTEVISAATATIMISSSSAAQIELKASGMLAPGRIRLSDPRARLEAKHIENVGFTAIGSRGSTPLYRANGIKRGIFGPRFSSGFRSIDMPANSEDGFAEFNPDDLFNNGD